LNTVPIARGVLLVFASLRSRLSELIPLFLFVLWTFLEKESTGFVWPRLASRCRMSPIDIHRIQLSKSVPAKVEPRFAMLAAFTANAYRQRQLKCNHRFT
jgi:hypothetical protein